MIGYIYKITNKINNKIYIGRHKSTIFDESYWGSGKLIKASINKYGVENFIQEIVEWCETLEQLCEREKYWINKLDAQNPSVGYNLAMGGEGGGYLGCNKGRKQPEEEKLKRANSLKKWYNENGGSKLKGVKRPELGKKLSDYYHSDQYDHKGHPASEKTKKMLSERNKTLTGEKNSYAKKIRCIETGKIYDWMGAAMKEFGLKSQGNLTRACKTGRTWAGYHWEYVDE